MLMSLEKFTAIRVYLPIARDAGLEAQLIALIQQSEPIGRVGTYSGLFEKTASVEGFNSMVRNDQRAAGICITTYAGSKVDAEVITQFVENVTKLHPWRQPIIEVQDVQMWINPEAGFKKVRGETVEEPEPEPKKRMIEVPADWDAEDFE